MSKDESVFFVEPLDADTNNTLARYIGEENFQTDVLCADDKRHQLWQCPSAVLLMLTRSRASMKTRFRVWGKTSNGKIYDKTRWYFARERTVVKHKTALSSRATF